MEIKKEIKDNIYKLSLDLVKKIRYDISTMAETKTLHYIMGLISYDYIMREEVEKIRFLANIVLSHRTELSDYILDNLK